MKLSYLLYCLLFGLFVISVSSCKKLSKTDKSSSKAIADTSLNPVIATATCDYAYDETTLTNTGWTKVFEENFDKDLSNWNVWTGGDYHDELQYYQPANLAVSNGTLQITAKPETATGATTQYDATPKTFNFTSGRIDSKMSFGASAATPKVRVMARMKLAPGYGLASAFWLLGDNWPTQGEIDVAIFRGDDPARYFTQYFYGTQVQQNIVKGSYLINRSDVDLTTCYHVYEMEWAQNTLTSYLDGKLVEVKTAGGHIPDLYSKPEHIVLNLSVGGQLYVKTPVNPALVKGGTFTVDYVKVFTSK